MTRRDLDWMLTGMGMMLVSSCVGFGLGWYTLFAVAFAACAASSALGNP
jgi:hypothetical protein